MKKLLYAIAIVATVFTGCSKDDSDDQPKPPAEGEITGEITANRTLAFGNYTLKGMVKIKSGVTLTIEAGTVITTDKTTGENGLIVLNGGKLIANGTADNPIVLTEKSKVPGSWAGIIMYGDAPIITTGGATSGTSEDGLVLPYGGTNAAHDGGSLKFVRVEYAGKVITSNAKEHNGFTFYSVGNKTVLENLVSYKGNDDGFEFFGGTVNAKNLVSYGNADDSFDWQDSWRGQENTNWFAYQTGTGNYGMEIEAKSNNNAFGPKVTNITLKRATGTKTEGQGEIQLDAFQFKAQGNGEYSNIIIDGYVNQVAVTDPNDPSKDQVARNGGAVQILDLVTYNDQVLTGKIKLTNVKVTNTPNLFITGGTGFTLSAASFGANWGPTTTATGAALTGGKWVTVDGVNLLANL